MQEQQKSGQKSQLLLAFNSCCAKFSFCSACLTSTVQFQLSFSSFLSTHTLCASFSSSSFSDLMLFPFTPQKVAVFVGLTFEQMNFLFLPAADGSKFWVKPLVLYQNQESLSCRKTNLHRTKSPLWWRHIGLCVTQSQINNSDRVCSDQIPLQR